MSLEIVTNKEKHPDEYSSLSNELWPLYILVFGQTGEGGINREGRTIRIEEYMSLLKGLNQQQFTSNELLNFIHEVDSIGSNSQDLVVVDGYKPFYTISGVKERFERDLESDEHRKPIAIFLVDKESQKVKGFLTGIVFDKTEVFQDIIEGMTFLDPQEKVQVVDYLRAAKIGGTILLEHEGAILMEERGGDAWSRAVNELHRSGRELGAKTGIVLTFADSNHYKGLLKHRQVLQNYSIGGTKDKPHMQFIIFNISEELVN